MSSGELRQFHIYFTIQHGFARRALAKLATIPSLRDIQECSVRLVRATVNAPNVASLESAAEIAQLRNTNMFLRMWLTLTRIEGPSPIAELTKIRQRRDDVPEKWLIVEPDDARVLLPQADLLRDALLAWRTARGLQFPCQTFEIQLSQFQGNNLRIWARVPFVDQLAAVLISDFPDTMGSLLYRRSQKNAHADVMFHVICEPGSTVLCVPISADWHPKPGLSAQRFKGIDHQDHNPPNPKKKPRTEAQRDVAAAEDDDENAKLDRVDDEESLKRKTMRDLDLDDEAVERGDDGLVDGEDPNEVWSETSREPPARLRRAETILQQRTSSLIIVIDKAFDWHNINAIFRSCDSLGVQHVWVISPLEGYKGTADRNFDINRRINKSTDRWLSVRVFASRKECLAALRAVPDLKIWACDVNDKAARLELPAIQNVEMPKRIALVMGHERTGVSHTMLAAADLHVYLPIFGFGSSLNLSVATALIIQRVFDLAPHFRGQMDEAERQELRVTWFRELATTPQNLEIALAFANADASLAPIGDLRREVFRTRPSAKMTTRMNALEATVEGAVSTVDHQ